MRSMMFATVLFTLTWALPPSAGAGVELFMPDGQLKSHPVRVFITHDITEAMRPRLLLDASHTISKEQPGENRAISPKWIARNQTVPQVKDGQTITVTGTLLLFDLKDYPIPYYKGMMRVVPILYWEEAANGGAAERRSAIGAGEVNVGNVVPAAVWTLSIVAALLLLIAYLSKAAKQVPLYLLCGDDGRLSLSRTQVALWTVGIGSMVTVYGLVRFTVPDIPESLVALMGLSFATGGVSYYQGQKETRRTGMAPPAPKLAHLLTDAGVDGKENLSLARAQMLFWTGVTLILFIVKSALDGVLWQVPWEMVWLMGMSQAGYLGPKMVKTGRSEAPPPAPP